MLGIPRKRSGCPPSHDRRVPTLSFALEFRGQATPVSPGVLLTRASGTHALLGVEEEALLEGRLSLLDGDSFELAATVGLGDGSAFRLRTLTPGVLAPAPETGLRIGTAVCEVDRGAGRLAGVSGRLATSFLLSSTGELTDCQVGVLFVDAAVREATAVGW